MNDEDKVNINEPLYSPEEKKFNVPAHNQEIKKQKEITSRKRKLLYKTTTP